MRQQGPHQDLTVLPEAFARKALAAYGLPVHTQLRLLTISENTTYAVREPDGRCSFLRVHRPGYHTRAAIESELAWIEALRCADVVSTPAVLPAAGGAPVVVSRAGNEVRHVVRFTWSGGAEPEEPATPALFTRLGAIAARLHLHTRTWRRPPWFTRLRWDYDGALGARAHWGRWQDGLGVGRAEREILGRLDAVLARRLREYGTGPDRFGLVHADMRLGNLLVESGGAGPDAVHVIDFDDCGFSWYGYDLAASLSFFEHAPEVPELMAAWVDGYRSQAPLAADDEAELPTFVLFRRLLLVAWIGSHADTELAAGLGEKYTGVSCDLAETFLSRNR